MATQKEIFYQYLLHERDRLEEDVSMLRQRLRLKADIDAVDCMELALAKERLSSFISYTNHAIAIFQMSCPADFEANLVRIDFTEYKKAAQELRKFKNRNKEKVGKK